MVADADAPDIADDVAALSIVEPPAFTAARNARAKELRATKDRERAALVAKLPKPSWTAWALNVLARQEPEVIGSWLAAGEALEAALGGGDREALRDAQRDERSALAATIERANTVLAGAGRKADDQTAPKFTGTLRAAITDASTRDRLIRGVLVDDVEASAIGFGFGFGLGPSDEVTGGEVVALDEARAKRSARTAAASKKAKRSGADTDTADEEARLAAEAAAEAKAAAAEAKRIEAERSRLEREVRALERELAARSAAAESAEEAAVAAREAADAAADAVTSAQAAVDDARAALDSLP